MKLAAKFRLGQIVATPAALESLSDSGQTPEFFLNRHLMGDWGTVSDGDRQLNEDALANGDRLMSVYQTLKNKPIWIITEADRSATTILLPDDY